MNELGRGGPQKKPTYLCKQVFEQAVLPVTNIFNSRSSSRTIVITGLNYEAIPSKDTHRMYAMQNAACEGQHPRTLR
jgi:hypothetical protein